MINPAFYAGLSIKLLTQYLHGSDIRFGSVVGTNALQAKTDFEHAILV
jgi:hypothetical protein